MLPSPSQAMSSVHKNCLADFLDNFTRVLSVLSTLHLRLTSSSAELNPPLTDCDSYIVDTSCSTSAEICPLFPLPQPLASDLIALGLPPPMAQYLSGAYIRAAARLKAKFETQLHRADRACMEIRLPEGFTTPRSQPYIRAIYASQFKQMVKSWAEIGMSSTRRRLLTTSLKNRFQVSISCLRPVASKEDFGTLPLIGRKTIEAKVLDASYNMEPSPPRTSIDKKTKRCAGLATRRSTVSSRCHGTLDRTILEPTCPAPVIKADPDAGLESTQGTAIKGAEPQGPLGKNHSPTSWDLTSFIHDFDGLSIRDRSEAVSSGNEDAFGACKVSPSERISDLFKPSSSTINRLPISAGVQSTVSSSRPRSSIQSPYDGDSHSASPLSTSKTIQSARRRKVAPCPNRDRSMQSTYKGPDVFFSRQTNDMTITSSAANAKESSDPTSHRISPSSSAHSRRRKIAHLPPRYPSTNTTALAVTISPDIHVPSQITSLMSVDNRQYSSETVRLTRPLPRSPSLTSLSSNESDLSSSDDLETPPSSPPPSSTMLPTPSSTHSVSPEKHRLPPLIFTPLDRGLSTLSRSTKVELPTRFPSSQPEIFSSVCAEDFSRFTFRQ
uniref:A2 mating type protein n=1 Tax=Heterobasidion parviporum TaxID=207832 RepID=S5RAB6_9AGAM|nr:a2 mating type protein [Heterobasidion parviporum]